MAATVVIVVATAVEAVNVARQVVLAAAVAFIVVAPHNNYFLQPEVASKIKSTADKILVRFSPDNSINVSIGKSHTLLPVSVDSKFEKSMLVITTNLDKPLRCGCGRSVQNLTQRDVLLRDEESVISSIGRLLACACMQCGVCCVWRA